jgi:dTDP-4-dehydrorhamnose reductase
MLGTGFIAAAPHFPRFKIDAAGRDELDVRDNHAVQSWCGRIEGGWVVHCASMVDVEGCARDPSLARSIIVDGARNVAMLAKQARARLLYPQSFLVYDGAETTISEAQQPRPLSLYGQLKYEAEQVISELLGDALIVRMAGFFGGCQRDKNFVGRIVPAIRAAVARGESIFSVGDRVWQPTWTNDLAFNSLHLMAARVTGIYHMASAGEATFHEVADEIVQSLGLQQRIKINPVSATAVSGSELGRRPNRAVLSCDRLDREGRNLQRSWKATLRVYLDDPFFNNS